MTTLDPIMTGVPLIHRLDDHNPWWQGTDAFREDGAQPLFHHTDLKSDFYPFFRDLAQDQLVIVSGPAMVGKTTMLYDLIAACTDPEFRARHIPKDESGDDEGTDEGTSNRGLLTDIVGDLDTAHPRQFLYIPLFDDPVYQIRAGEQLNAAIDRFKEGVRPPTSNLVLLLDDVHTLHRSGEETWTATVTRLIEEGWRVVLTTTAPRRTWNTLQESVEDLIDAGHLAGAAQFDEWVTSMMPWKFRDFVEYRYPELSSHGDEDRFSSSGIRDGFYESVINEEQGPETFADALIENASHLPDIDWETEIALYTFLGGTLGIRLADDPDFPLESPGHLFNKLMDQRERFEDQRANVLERYRDKLHRQAANSDINLADLEDPERLLGLTAYLLSGEKSDAPSPVEGISFEDLTDTFEVDRRTLRNKYFTLLDQFYLLTASEEYDNQRPKEVRLYSRDFGLVHAFADRSFERFWNASRVRDETATVAAFDHTVRLSYTKNDPRDPKRGRVKFWPHDGAVDFVIRFDGRPVPIVFADVACGDDLDLTSPPVTTFDAFFGAGHDSEQDPIADHHASALAAEDLVERRKEYVKSDAYAGAVAEEARSGAPVATDGDAPFGILLTRGSDDPLTEQVKVWEKFARKKIVELPLELYLLFA